MSKFKDVMSIIWGKIKWLGGKIKWLVAKVWERFKSKNFGFYVALAAWLLTFIHMITYSQIENVGEGLFHPGVIISCAVALVAFLVLAWFKVTSKLAPAVLMVSDLLCLFFFANSGNFQDFFSTNFFEGFSFGLLFSLGVPLWFSLFSFLISFVIASVAMYMPQERKPKTENPTCDEVPSTENA